MIFMRYFTIVLCIFSNFAFAAKKTPESISIMSLIVNPDKYDNKIIIVDGFIRLGLKKNSIFINKESRYYNITKNGLFLNMKDVKDIPKKLSKECRYLIHGTFSKSKKRYKEEWSGSLNSIQKFERIPDYQYLGTVQKHCNSFF